MEFKKTFLQSLRVRIFLHLPCMLLCISACNNETTVEITQNTSDNPEISETIDTPEAFSVVEGAGGARSKGMETGGTRGGMETGGGGGGMEAGGGGGAGDSAGGSTEGAGTRKRGTTQIRPDGSGMDSGGDMAGGGGSEAERGKSTTDDSVNPAQTSTGSRQKPTTRHSPAEARDETTSATAGVAGAGEDKGATAFEGRPERPGVDREQRRRTSQSTTDSGGTGSTESGGTSSTDAPKLQERQQHYSREFAYQRQYSSSMKESEVAADFSKRIDSMDGLDKTTKDKILKNVDAQRAEAATAAKEGGKDLYDHAKVEKASTKYDSKMQEFEKASTILDVVTQVAPDHQQEVMSGAHVMIPDGGKLYDSLIKTGYATDRISSHHNADKVVGSDGKPISDASIQGGKIFNEFLFGKTASGDSWFQMEGSAWGRSQPLSANAGHIKDFAKYFWTGDGQAQYGSSKNVDTNEIRLIPNGGSIVGDEPRGRFPTRVANSVADTLESAVFGKDHEQNWGAGEDY